MRNAMAVAFLAGALVACACDGGQMQSYFHLSDRERYLLARFVISLRESPVSGARHDSND